MTKLEKEILSKYTKVKITPYTGERGQALENKTIKRVDIDWQNKTTLIFTDNTYIIFAPINTWDGGETIEFEDNLEIKTLKEMNLIDDKTIQEINERKKKNEEIRAKKYEEHQAIEALKRLGKTKVEEILKELK